MERAVLLDIVPTKAMYENVGMLSATVYYHWFFLIQEAPFPERLIGGYPKAFLEY